MLDMRSGALFVPSDDGPRGSAEALMTSDSCCEQEAKLDIERL